MYIWLLLVLLLIIFGKRIFIRTCIILNWMILNGYFFPKTMRADRDKNIARLQKLNAEHDKVIENRSMRR